MCRTQRILVVLLTLIAATGCTHRAETGRGDGVFAAPAPARTQLGHVPLVVQEDEQCAAASLFMVSQSLQLSTPHDHWKSQVFTPGREGALPSDMLTAPRRNGLNAFLLDTPQQLPQALAEGYPAIVLLNLRFDWWPQWHYAVVTGYDREADFVTLHAGRDKSEKWGINLFDRLWQRAGNWGVVLSPATRLPQFATAEQAMRSAIGLEKANQLKAAYVAYHRIGERFSDQCTAFIGMGNTAYKLEQIPAASRAWQQAAGFAKCADAARNNLAEISAP